MSENDKAAQDTPAPDTEQNIAPQSVDPFTVLFNAVEIANRRGAYSLRESGVISRALDIVRSSVQVQPAAEPVSDTPSSAEKTEDPSIEASS